MIGFLRTVASLLLGLGLLAGPAGAMTIRELPIPGTAAFARVAKDIAGVMVAYSPDLAANAGLFEDAIRVPSFTPAAVRVDVARLDRDLAALRAMPWRSWSVDRQIDFRYMYANAELTRTQLVRERLFLHRPAQWLEPVSNVLIALITYAPARVDLMARELNLVPAMVAEMRSVVAAPTARDVATAREIIDAFGTMCKPALEPAYAAIDANHAAHAKACANALPPLVAYASDLAKLESLPDVAVIGATAYAEQLRDGLVPYAPARLLAMAERELATVDAQMARLKPSLEASPAPSQAQIAQAQALTKDQLLGLYDAIEVAHRAELERRNIVTIPKSVGPIHARETPDAMVALTGDGGSMNAPPPYVATNVGYWNVEHFHGDWPLAEREDKVVRAEDYRLSSMGPYSVHEGVPGHHLQLSIARANPDPIRSIFADAVQNEGWALYAEEMFWKAGGLGDSVAAHYFTLRSWRARVRRVVYDVNVESGAWTLQRAADWKDGAPAGQGKVEGDLVRTFNWPAQLICYFAGKMQILDLKAAYKKKLGARYSERAFHDAFLAVGSVPIVFARAKLLGEPVPGL